MLKHTMGFANLDINFKSSRKANLSARRPPLPPPPPPQ